MKINFICYLNPLIHNGGGEAIAKRLIEVGNEISLDIKVSSFRPFRLKFHRNPDATILCDLSNSSAYPKGLSFLRFPSWFVQLLTKRGKTFYLTNAYTNLCNLDYLPCNGQANSVCKFSGKKCFALSRYSKKIHSCVDSYIFLSPLHKQVSEEIFSRLSIKKSTDDLILKPFIDTQLFSNSKKIKKIKKLFVGVISEAKGIKNYENSDLKNEITYAGKNPYNEKISGNHIGHLEYSEIAELMSQSEEFIYWPRWPEPQGRVVVEAALSGCKLNCNENVGATSFNFDISDPKNINGNEYDAWDKIKCLVS